MISGKQPQLVRAHDHRIQNFRTGLGRSVSHSHLGIDMIEFPNTLTRRSVFRAGAGLAVAVMGTSLLTPAAAYAEDVRQAGADPLKR